ncbi:hypothetical protein [Acinetobacter bereziniae]|uniref:hypothetical protein n=1 Tax=Acinetobacter bereziniae TaxID=106648 RepID=UPI0018DB4A92|nr:hypothetical protein [Acinetobacter bereziniae]MBI0394491.1 hypothetical protein [Acinetobacter bereziniae]
MQQSHEKLKEIKHLIAIHDYTNRPNAKLKIAGGVSGSIGYTKATGILVEPGAGDHVEKGKGLLTSFKKTMKSVDNAFSLCVKDKVKLHMYADPYIKKLEGALAMPVRIQPTGKRI